MTNQWFQKAWWLDWGDSEITGIGNVLYAFFRAFVLFWSCTMDSFCFYCLKLRRTWNEAKFFDYIKSYVRARFNQGAFVSGHVLISWTHTSYSTCYFVDALRCVLVADINMAAYNHPLYPIFTLTKKNITFGYRYFMPWKYLRSKKMKNKTLHSD